MFLVIQNCLCFGCSIEETWTLWQDFYEQCHVVEDWLSAAEDSLAKTSEEVRQPGEDEQMRVIVIRCILSIPAALNKSNSLLNAIQSVM